METNYRALQSYCGMYYSTSIENLLFDEVKNPYSHISLM